MDINNQIQMIEGKRVNSYSAHEYSTDGNINGILMKTFSVQIIFRFNGKLDLR